MTKVLKETSEVLTVLKQYRNQSNNYKPNTKIYADLFKVSYSDGRASIVCETELD